MLSWTLQNIFLFLTYAKCATKGFLALLLSPSYTHVVSHLWQKYFIVLLLPLVKGEDGLMPGAQLGHWDNFSNCFHLKDSSGVWYWHYMPWWGLFPLKCDSFLFTSLLVKSTQKYFSVIFTKVILVSVMADLAGTFVSWVCFSTYTELGFHSASLSIFCISSHQFQLMVAQQFWSHGEREKHYRKGQHCPSYHQQSSVLKQG